MPVFRGAPLFFRGRNSSGDVAVWRLPFTGVPGGSRLPSRGNWTRMICPMDDLNRLETEGAEEQPPRKVEIVDRRFDRDEIMREETPEEKAARLKREAEAEKAREAPPKPEREKPPAAPRGGEAAARAEVAADEAEMKREFVSLFDLGIDGFLKQNLGIMLNFAYIYMGLVANPATGLVTQDLGKAKLAIDTFEFTVDKLKGILKPQEEKELQRLLKDLKLNFMNAASAPAPKPPGKGKPG